MDWDDLKPKPAADRHAGRKPGNASRSPSSSSASLALTAEIERVRQEMQAKKAHEAAAAAVFKR